jgi:hypothetical protein
MPRPPGRFGLSSELPVRRGYDMVEGGHHAGMTH